MPKIDKNAPRRGKNISNKEGVKSRKRLMKEQLMSLGFDPIESLVEIAKISKKNEDIRLYFDVAKELAQYVAPKLKAIEFEGEVHATVDAITKVELVAPKKS